MGGILIVSILLDFWGASVSDDKISSWQLWVQEFCPL